MGGEGTEKANHREHGEHGEKQTTEDTARQARNQTGVAAVVSPATRSRGGMKIFARGEDFRGSQYRECLLCKRSLEGIRMAALPAERRQVRVALGEGVAPGDYSGTAAIQ